MTELLLFYAFFSYFLVLGIKMKQPNLPTWNFLLAPLTLPIIIGQYLAR